MQRLHAILWSGECFFAFLSSHHHVPANANHKLHFSCRCWVQNVEKEAGEMDDIRHGSTVFLAFDESGLINNAEWGEEIANIRCGTLLQQDGESETWSSCRFQYHASRDIAAGDELLINYSEFEDKSQMGWVDFGVGVGITIGQ
jgi:hypothetical protein